jgi:hypothetical protein
MDHSRWHDYFRSLSKDSPPSIHRMVVVYLLWSVRINLNWLYGITYYFSKYFGFADVNIEGFVIV